MTTLICVPRIRSLLQQSCIDDPPSHARLLQDDFKSIRYCLTDDSFLERLQGTEPLSLSNLNHGSSSRHRVT